MRYVFADCVLDTALATLHRAGRAIPLRPKVFHLLQYLLEQRAHLVAKDTLCAQVWPGQYISDAALEGCIKLARQALGDSGREQRLIQTRRGYGYRFVGAVQEQAVGAPPRRPEPALPMGESEASPAGAEEAMPRLPVTGVADGERKLVTLLGCTLAHTVARCTPLGLDALHSRMRILYALAQRQIQQYGGTLHHVAGDRLLAVFGAPLAYEDHARRAVLAALGILQRLIEHREEGEKAGREPLLVCMGLHTGLLIIGGLGEAQGQGPAVVGELTLTVEALQAHAEPGTLLCSEATARLIRAEMLLEAHQPVPVPGQPTPLLAYHVFGVYPRDVSVVRRIGRAEGPFVGRTQALVTLHTLLAQVEAGRGQAVGIVGEPGIGKSRLLTEFYSSLQGRQLRYLHGRCLSYGQATPFLPVLDLLRHSCDLTAADGPEGITAKIHHRLREVEIAPEEAAPYLLALLGVETGTDGLAELAPEVRKARTFATLVQFCIHSSQPCPLILEVEDLHWSDAISAEWLTALVERVGHVPLLVLGTYRPGYRPAWLDKSYATQVALQPLSPSDSRHIVQALLPMAQRSAALEQAILTKADGNPFFLEELAQTVVEQGGHVLALGVPDTVQAVLAARIDRLPPAEKHLLQITAVIGTEVPVSLLQAVAELEDEQLYRGLAQLQAAEFLYETWRLLEPSYIFKHALTQEVAYQSLLKSTRQQFHQRTAQVLEVQFSDTVETQPELLAQHYTEAGLTAQAVGYWQKASRSAVQRSAHVEAISHLTKGLELLKALPETSQRLQREVDMHIALGASLFATKGYAAPEVGETYTYAQQLCQHLEDPYQRFAALRGLWSYYLAYSELLTAHALSEQLLTLAQQVQDTAMLCLAHRALGSTLLFLGAVAAAHRHFAQGMALYDPQQHRVYAFLHGDDAGVICRIYAAWTLWYLGYPAQGLTRSHEAVTLAQQLTHPFSLGWVLSAAAMFHQFRREARCAQECAEAVLGLATAQGFTQWIAYGSMLRGWALVHQGQAQAGITQLTEGLTAQRATGAEILRPYFLALLVEVYGTLGQPEAGLTVLTEALSLADKTGVRWHEPELYRLKGDLLLRQSSDNATDAESYFHHALEIARNQQAKAFELRAVTSLAQLWQQQGRRQEAYDLLAPVYNWFTEGFDTADLREAKVLLEELGA